MAKDASEALGAPQVAGTNVVPKGFTRKMTFTEGQVWEFEVARSFRKSAVHLVETLGGTVD